MQPHAARSFVTRDANIIIIPIWVTPVTPHVVGNNSVCFSPKNYRSFYTAKCTGAVDRAQNILPNNTTATRLSAVYNNKTKLSHWDQVYNNALRAETMRAKRYYDNSTERKYKYKYIYTHTHIHWRYTGER